MFVSTHYGGQDFVIQFGKGEPWKKVFGPVFIYLNSVADKNDTLSLWDDAKERVYHQGIKANFYTYNDLLINSLSFCVCVNLDAQRNRQLAL